MQHENSVSLNSATSSSETLTVQDEKSVTWNSKYNAMSK